MIINVKNSMSFIRRKIHNITHPVLGRILMLHRVVEHRSDEENRELEITPDFLEQTIETYRRQGQRFVPIDEACEIIVRSRTDHPFVCLTFDYWFHRQPTPYVVVPRPATWPWFRGTPSTGS